MIGTLTEEHIKLICGLYLDVVEIRKQLGNQCKRNQLVRLDRMRQNTKEFLKLVLYEL